MLYYAECRSAECRSANFFSKTNSRKKVFFASLATSIEELRKVGSIKKLVKRLRLQIFDLKKVWVCFEVLKWLLKEHKGVLPIGSNKRECLSVASFSRLVQPAYWAHS
jgi:hypothetical protein